VFGDLEEKVAKYKVCLTDITAYTAWTPSQLTVSSSRPNCANWARQCLMEKTMMRMIKTAMMMRRTARAVILIDGYLERV
jgi:hypothetical protein